jgi:hypothetical protein
MRSTVGCAIIGTSRAMISCDAILDGLEEEKWIDSG